MFIQPEGFAMTTKAIEANVTEVFDSALRTYGDAMKAGVRMQEDVAKWWADALEAGGPIQDWQKRSRAVFTETVPAAQKNAEEWLKLVEQNYRRSMELLRKAMQQAQNVYGANGASDVAEEARERTQELWRSSIELVQENVSAMAQANAKMLELWSGMLKNVNAPEMGGLKPVPVKPK
jgi:polyhydroxyalkanoate synthesis regulator protein